MKIVDRETKLIQSERNAIIDSLDNAVNRRVFRH